MDLPFEEDGVMMMTTAMGGGSLEEPEGRLRLDFAPIREWWALDGATLRAVPQTQFFFSQKYRAIFGDILRNVLKK